MSELEDKQRIYDLTSELEALKPKADSYRYCRYYYRLCSNK